MPNWCFTRITINSDHNKLKSLEKKIDEWTSNNYKENGFGNNWLGNIVLGSGIGTVNTDKETDLRCRGSMTYMELIDEQLLINTETAWAPMLKMWIKVLEKYAPGAELLYEAEESGCGLYCTNDPRLDNCYIIDSWDMDGVDSDWEASEETVVSVLQKLLNTTESDVKILLEMFYKKDYSEKMNIVKWDFAEVDELD